MKTKRLNIQEIRMKLHKFHNELIKYRARNKLTNKYLRKVTYMLMWFRLIPINKDVLNGWSMPDYNDINEFKKRGKLKLAEKKTGDLK